MVDGQADCECHEGLALGHYGGYNGAGRLNGVIGGTSRKLRSKTNV